VGKIVHNFGGLACNLGVTNPHNQSPKLPRNQRTLIRVTKILYHLIVGLIRLVLFCCRSVPFCDTYSEQSAVLVNISFFFVCFFVCWNCLFVCLIVCLFVCLFVCCFVGLLESNPKNYTPPPVLGWEWPAVVCVLLGFIRPILGNRYVRSRGFIVSEPRETHPRSEISIVPTSPCPPLENLGYPDPHPPP